MSINKNRNGFVSILAMVVVIGVVGGGIVLSSATIKNVAGKECEGYISAWQRGEIYDDIASNKEGAIEKAQKCQEAVRKATEVAKANAALLGRASNINSNGAELILTEIVNTTMDYVENASDVNYKPLQKNNDLPEDIKSVKQNDLLEKIDTLLESEERGDKEEEQVVVDEDIDQKTEESSTDMDSLEEDKINNNEDINNDKKDDCFIGIPKTSSPKVLAVCDSENMGFWYADREGDIANISVRFRFSYPEFNGQQDFDWQTAKFESDGDSYCDFQPAIKFDHPSVPAGFRANITVDIMLEDSKGNKSNISSCTI